MARYDAADLHRSLYEHDCLFDGDETETGLIWYTAGGHVFTIPKAVDGWLDADVIDRILTDRWIPRTIGNPKRYQDDEAR